MKLLRLTWQREGDKAFYEVFTLKSDLNWR